MVTIVANAINKCKIPTLANLTTRKENRERLAPANSRVAKKTIKLTTIAILMIALSPKVVTVVTVVIIS